MTHCRRRHRPCRHAWAGEVQTTDSPSSVGVGAHATSAGSTQVARQLLAAARAPGRPMELPGRQGLHGRGTEVGAVQGDALSAASAPVGAQWGRCSCGQASSAGAVAAGEAASQQISLRHHHGHWRHHRHRNRHTRWLALRQLPLQLCCHARAGGAADSAVVRLPCEPSLRQVSCCPCLLLLLGQLSPRRGRLQARGLRWLRVATRGCGGGSW